LLIVVVDGCVVIGGLVVTDGLGLSVGLGVAGGRGSAGGRNVLLRYSHNCEKSGIAIVSTFHLTELPAKSLF